jgi:pimeloyl-ACP methyl ester carboxylesterase
MLIDPVRNLLSRLPPSRRATLSVLKQLGHRDSCRAGRITDEMLAWDSSLQRDTDTMRNDGGIIGLAGGWRGFDTTLTLSDELLRSVATPTLLLWGTEDSFGGADVARRVAALLPNATLRLLPKSGHLPWLDDERGLADETTGFLRDGC